MSQSVDIEDHLHVDNPVVLGYKIVGDNIDKNILPRYNRQSYQTVSMHCFNSYAVHDRVSIHGLSDVPPNVADINLLSIPVTDILPSMADHYSITNNFTIISRMLTSHLTHFKDNFNDVVDRHIKHDYYSQMSSKSEIVSSYAFQLHYDCQ